MFDQLESLILRTSVTTIFLTVFVAASLLSKYVLGYDDNKSLLLGVLIGVTTITLKLDEALKNKVERDETEGLESDVEEYA